MQHRFGTGVGFCFYGLFGRSQGQSSPFQKSCECVLRSRRNKIDDNGILRRGRGLLQSVLQASWLDLHKSGGLLDVVQRRQDQPRIKTNPSLRARKVGTLTTRKDFSIFDSFNCVRELCFKSRNYNGIRDHSVRNAAITTRYAPKFSRQ